MQVTVASRLKVVMADVAKMSFDRSPTVVSTDSEYMKQLPHIRELYSDVGYWHGTGRYKYSTEGELEDILAGIVRYGGLLPHDDDWDRKRGYIRSISVARSRMYARLYAGMFCPAATRIDNELGSRELWGYYFLGTSGIVGMFEYFPNIPQLKRGDDSSTLIPGFRRKSRRWTAKITARELSLKDTFLFGTDIAENYPILLALRQGVVKTSRGSRFVELHEKRSESLIPLSAVCHVEVPRIKVTETQEMLSVAGHDEVVVVPIEFGEEFSRKFSFRALTSGKPLRE